MSGFGKTGGWKRHGSAISTEQLQQLLTMEPRRHRLDDPAWYQNPWNAMRTPLDETKDWSLSFPFFETFCPAFDEYCLSQSDASPIEKTPFERQDSSRESYTYLKNTNSEQLDNIGGWVNFIGGFVGIRDFLRVSFTLDYTREAGSPDNAITEIAGLRQKAKLYGSSDTPSTQTLAAASRLAEDCVNFIEQSRAYHRTNAMIAVPRSDPTKKYSLPAFIAERIANDLSLADLSAYIRTTKTRREMKETPANERLAELDGTIEVTEEEAVKGKRILIVDDLYQSGTTMNYVGMLLLNAGASCVYGLACEKTCSNQD